MKIRDIIIERKNATKVGNDKATIARTAKQASATFDGADKGAIDGFYSKKARKKVRDMYGVELVDDFVDVLELPNGEKDTDKAMSMFSKDQRKK